MVGIVTLTIRWLPPAGTRRLVSVGVVWVVLTVAFEVSLGRGLLGYSWHRLASDYNMREGGLLPIGLAVMVLSPVIATWLRARCTPRRRGVSLFRYVWSCGLLLLPAKRHADDLATTPAAWMPRNYRERLPPSAAVDSG